MTFSRRASCDTNLSANVVGGALYVDLLSVCANMILLDGVNRSSMDHSD